MKGFRFRPVQCQFAPAAVFYSEENYGKSAYYSDPGPAVPVRPAVLLLPVRLAVKIAVHSGCSFLCLWLLNTAAGLTGVYLPINAVTVLLSGFLGIPGIALVALLELRKL